MLPDNKVTVIMYHYVRELQKSRFPKINGLEFLLFKEQLDYFSKHYTFITIEELIFSIDNNTPLPPKSILLTFDDGYLDHYTYVFPELVKRKIQGSFYIPAKTILDNSILDVNKIHHIIASCDDTDELVKNSFEKMNFYRDEYQLSSNDYYFSKLAIKTRYDSNKTAYFKRLLQKELPYELRTLITSELFKKYVNIDESEFSKSFYMNQNQLREMLNEKMHIGHHGYDHLWLNTLTETQQLTEVSLGCQFLKELGVDMNQWTICYPYGAYSKSIIKILIQYNCKLGLTTHVDVPNLSTSNRFKIPRLDTNDFPKSAVAAPNDWYLKA